MQTSSFSLDIRKIVYTAVASLIALLIIIPAYNKSREARSGFMRNDINFIWQDGKDIAEGKNPYSRIHNSNMRLNDKYTTYFPGFFLAVSATYKLGVHTLAEFIKYWRPISLLSLVLMGAITFYIGLGWGLPWAVAAGGFVWFSRWTLNVLNTGQIDLFAILLLLIGLILLDRGSYRGWIMIGISLAVKQMALFAIPALLLCEMQANGYKSAFKAALLIGIIPAIISIPFLITDPSGYLLSIFFSAVRKGGSFGPESYDRIVDITGLAGRAIMLALMLALTSASLTGKLSRYAIIALMMGIFVSFNSVLLKQYVAWIIPFVPLAIMKLQQKPVATI